MKILVFTKFKCLERGKDTTPGNVKRRRTRRATRAAPQCPSRRYIPVSLICEVEKNLKEEIHKVMQTITTPRKKTRESAFKSVA